MSRSYLPLAALAALLLACTGLPADDAPVGDDPPRGPHGKFDATGSCEATLCDGPSPDGTCWCDDLCVGYGDCCADRAAVCEPDDDGDEDGGGDVDPDAHPAAACGGPALTAQQALSLFDPGASDARLGVYRFFARERICNDATGCTAWSESTIELGAAEGRKRHALERVAGTTALELADAAGSVRLTLGDWCQVDVGGALACDLDALFADGGAFETSPGSITETCGTMTAVRAVDLDGISRREEELVLRLDHGVERGDISADLSDAFVTPRVLTASCERFNWGYQYTCQGRTETTVMVDGAVTASLAGDSLVVSEPEGALAFHGDSSLWLGTFPLDEQGSAEAHESHSSPTYGSASSMDTHIQLVGDLLIYEAEGYRNHGTNWCGASSGYAHHCIAVFTVGLDD